MQCTTQIQGPVGVLKLEGRFTFESHQEFRRQTAALLESAGLQEIRLDFSGLNYLDSNALGMMLLLRERARPRNLEIRIANPSPAVQDILDLVQFGKLFNIVVDPLR